MPRIHQQWNCNNCSLHGEILTGCNHIDITRDDDGIVKLYFDGTLSIDYILDFPYENNIQS